MFGYRYSFGVSDAFTQLGEAAIVGLIYGLLVLLPTIFMKMKAKDRLTIFISSFICIMVTFFIVLFMQYVVWNVIILLLVPLLFLVLMDGFIYTKMLTYKKMNGFLVSAVTNAVTIGIYFLLVYLWRIIYIGILFYKYRF